jgi:hypothetical protein
VRIALNKVLAAVLTYSLALAGCSQKQFTPKDLKAEIQNAQRLSRECAMVLELRLTGKLTTPFRKTHELYLLKQFAELKKTADEAQPKAAIQQTFEEYKQTLSALEDALRKIQAEPHKQRFEEIANQLGALEKEL